MKFGVADYGISVWDGGYYDFELRLQELKSIGYDGTERLECTNAAEALEKAAVYRKMGMDFATCRGPNVECNLRFTAGLGKEYVWLTPGECDRKVDMDVFIRRSKRLIYAASRYGLKVALHNHLGQRIQNQDELDYFMKEVPEAYLLLDMGHLFGAGGDLVPTIERYFDRLASVHFKDVFIKDETKTKDEWWERLRFCELGGGNAGEPWADAAKTLKKLGYDKWVLIEQDTHLQDPLIDLKHNLEQMKAILA